jgi:serine/alanine adding enzyme
MNWTVLSADDAVAWGEAVAGIGGGDPYFDLDYHAAYDYDGGRSYLYVHRDGGGRTLVYPFRLHPIRAVGDETLDGTLADIETVYGYSGPLADNDDPDFLRQAWDGFSQWAAEHRVVSEFCRFHPLMGAERFAAPDMRVIHDRETVTVNLECGEAALWASYESVLRNRVRKAQAAGLICRKGRGERDMEVFRVLYEETMRMLDARSFYLFPESYYADLARMGDRLRLFLVESGGAAIAGAIFLVGGGSIHYHLGGSRPDSRALAPNNLLFHTVARWGQDHGLRRLFLGGGRTNRADDELLRFKRRFSPAATPFFMGKRVWNPAAYETLSAAWCRQSGQTPPPHLQHYRLPVRQDGDGR